MGYIHIDNLYKNKGDIFLFREVYVLEKIHGTSAKVMWRGDQDMVRFFTGEGNHKEFVSLFNYDNLYQKFKEIGRERITVYGENYGGKLQRMNKTYGNKKRFVAFEVKIDENWLDVPNAAQIADHLGLDFVSWHKCSCDLETLTYWRDQPSEQAVKCGITEPRKREGIVIHPLIEVTKNDGKRVLSKYKTEKFRETKTPRPIDAEKLVVLKEAKEIADEWVTEMRLTHVLQNFTNPSIGQMADIISVMIEDIEREAEGEIVVSREARTAIGRNTAFMFKNRLKQQLKDIG